MKETRSGRPETQPKYASAIIAGGQARRLGGKEKCLLKINSKSIIETQLNALNKSSTLIFVNTNSDPSLFSGLKIQLVPDISTEKRGPLDGVLACLRQMRLGKADPKWLLTVPADCPFLPEDLGYKLFGLTYSTDNETQNSQTSVVYATHQERDHYLCALWSIDMEENIERYLQSGQRSVKGLFKRIHAKKCEFLTVKKSKIDPFFNINTHEDFEQAKKIAAQSEGMYE